VASFRKLDSGKWQATVRIPGGSRKARTFARRHHAEAWAHMTEQAVNLLDRTHQEVTVTWSPDGLDIHVPDELITMDMAAALERAIDDILTRES
jgi:hypothetical protein